MKVYIGADYCGFECKNRLVEFLRELNYDTEDLGAFEKVEGDDFNDPAVRVSEKVRREVGSFGVLICDSAHGMTMQANRFRGIRAAHCFSSESTRLAREHDDANVLCMSAHFLEPVDMEEVLITFLKTPFEPLERRVRRIKKLDEEVYD